MVDDAARARISAAARARWERYRAANGQSKKAEAKAAPSKKSLLPPSKPPSSVPIRRHDPLMVDRTAGLSKNDLRRILQAAVENTK